jgi:hypothetical protein
MDDDDPGHGMEHRRALYKPRLKDDKQLVGEGGGGRGVGATDLDSLGGAPEWSLFKVKCTREY